MLVAFSNRIIPLCSLTLALLLTGSAAIAGAQVSSSVASHSSDVVYPDQAKVTFDANEATFFTLAALSACESTPAPSGDFLRQHVRSEIAVVTAASTEAASARRNLCSFVAEHSVHDESRDLGQYISLALYLTPPPELRARVPESDLPPDAAYVLGFIGELKRFATAIKLHEIWIKHRPEYDALLLEFHEPVAKLISGTDYYLRFPISGYLGRQMVVIVEPMGANSQVNARHYGTDYFLVLSPAPHSLKLDAIRHLYLHYLLDPLVDKKYASIKRFEPILEDVATAPMEPSFKDDIRLLVVESLIRAIEARDPGSPRPKDKAGLEAMSAARESAVENAMRDGFVLTRYFYERLAEFERDQNGLQDAFNNWIYNLDLAHERKLARDVRFNTTASPELVHASKPAKVLLLVDQAEDSLAQNDLPAAKEYAERALQQRSEDPARAMFILARVAAKQGAAADAQRWFERTLTIASEPRVVAWSHIYLGRLFDLRDQRGDAVKQYRAALTAGDPTPDTRSAAEAGMAKPYEPHHP